MFIPLRITPKGEPIAVLTIMYKTTHSLDVRLFETVDEAKFFCSSLYGIHNDKWKKVHDYFTYDWTACTTLRIEEKAVTEAKPLCEA